MKLREQISNFLEEGAKQAPPEMLQKVMGEIQRLAETGIAQTALKVGDKIPEINLPDSDGNVVSISTLLEKGNVIISFSRGTSCPFCSLEYKALQEKLPEINQGKGKIIGISPQLPETAKEILKKNGIDFPILFDKGNVVASQFGLVWTLSEEYRPINKAFGFDTVTSNGDESYELPIPATYVVNQQGEIIYAFVNPSWLERANPEDYITFLNN